MHSPHNHPDIKIGEIYNLRIHVIGKSEDFIIARPITQNGGYATSSFLEILHKYAPSFTPIPSEHGTSVPTPKHDPTRRFKKGDVVRFKEHLGRKSLAHTDKLITLEEDECDGMVFWTEMNEYGDIIHRNAYFCFLELVTPVEELEPYYVGVYSDQDDTYYDVATRNGFTVVRFDDGLHPHAKEAAEAECARLNEEYRKEQK